MSGSQLTTGKLGAGVIAKKKRRASLENRAEARTTHMRREGAKRWPAQAAVASHSPQHKSGNGQLLPSGSHLDVLHFDTVGDSEFLLFLLQAAVNECFLFD